MNQRNFLKAIFLVLFFSIALFGKISASNTLAGQITYQLKSGSANCYVINVGLYTYFSSTVDRDSIEIVWGDGTYEVIPRISKVDSGNNILINTFSGEHCYNIAIPFVYIISVMYPNKIADIINVNNPNHGNPNNSNSSQIPFYIESSLSTVDYCGVKNNSHVIFDMLIYFAKVGEIFTYNSIAYDIEGDSLSYELVAPDSSYEFPDSVYDGYNDEFSINSSSGQIIWNTPQIAGIYDVAVKTTEWRKCGNLVFEVGYIIREMMIFVGAGTTGVNDLSNEFSENISIYPNPFSSQAVVRITNGYEFTNEKLELEIYDVLGKEVHHQALSTKHETLNLNLPSGIYFYKITSDQKPVANGKLIITD